MSGSESLAVTFAPKARFVAPVDTNTGGTPFESTGGGARFETLIWMGVTPGSGLGSGVYNWTRVTGSAVAVRTRPRAAMSMSFMWYLRS